jgi:hypothetical protein
VAPSKKLTLATPTLSEADAVITTFDTVSPGEEMAAVDARRLRRSRLDDADRDTVMADLVGEDVVARGRCGERSGPTGDRTAMELSGLRDSECRGRSVVREKRVTGECNRL